MGYYPSHWLTPSFFKMVKFTNQKSFFKHQHMARSVLTGWMVIINVMISFFLSRNLTSIDLVITMEGINHCHAAMPEAMATMANQLTEARETAAMYGMEMPAPHEAERRPSVTFPPPWRPPEMWSDFVWVRKFGDIFRKNNPRFFWDDHHFSRSIWMNFGVFFNQKNTFFRHPHFMWISVCWPLFCWLKFRVSWWSVRPLFWRRFLVQARLVTMDRQDLGLGFWEIG